MNKKNNGKSGFNGSTVGKKVPDGYTMKKMLNGTWKMVKKTDNKKK